MAAFLLVSAAGALAFGWTHFEPFHRARRDADRVFHTLTGTAPRRHASYGNYLGFDAAPTAEVFGPLTTETTVRAEMGRFATALSRAGYHPDQWATSPRTWCNIQDNFWGPNEPAPNEVQIHCSVNASNAQNTAHARLSLDFEVPPAQLEPTRTATGYTNVYAENAIDLLVGSGTLEADAWRNL